MSKLTGFLNNCANRGQSATIYNRTGTQCPCWDWRGKGYNPQYHADYPAAEECSGTGLISSTTTETDVKAFFYHVGLVGLTSLPENIKAVIGDRVDADLIMFGTAKTEDNSLFDLTDMETVSTKREDYITYDSVDYRVEKVYKMAFGGQIALLKRK